MNHINKKGNPHIIDTSQKDITDHDRYILNQKLDVIKDIRV